MRIFIVCLAIFCCSAGRAGAQEPPRALAGFHLGMSVDEARAVAPRLRWPSDAAAASFRVQSRPVELGGGRFYLSLLFVRGVLEHISTERGWTIPREPDACLRALDDIVEDLETQLGPLDGAPTEGEGSGPVTSETRTPLGSHVRHYRNEESGARVGVAYANTTQRVEARALIMPGGNDHWGCVFMVSVAPNVAPSDAPLIDEATPRLTNIVWLERPAAMDFARAYPSQAMQASRGGDVVLDCRVETGGLINCALSSESPEGWGFGAAALALSRQFRIAPQTQDGVATEGGRVLLPIRFRPG